MVVMTVLSILTADFILPCFIDQSFDMPMFLYLSGNFIIAGFKTWTNKARKTSNVSNLTLFNTFLS